MQPLFVDTEISKPIIDAPYDRTERCHVVARDP